MRSGEYTTRCGLIAFRLLSDYNLSQLPLRDLTRPPLKRDRTLAVKGQWTILYDAVDKDDATLSFCCAPVGRTMFEALRNLQRCVAPVSYSRIRYTRTCVIQRDRLPAW